MVPDLNETSILRRLPVDSSPDRRGITRLRAQSKIPLKMGSCMAIGVAWSRTKTTGSHVKGSSQLYCGRYRRTSLPSVEVIPIWPEPYTVPSPTPCFHYKYKGKTIILYHCTLIGEQGPGIHANSDMLKQMKQETEIFHYTNPTTMTH